MTTPRHIVAVLAHPDDETFICGGTLARYSKEGARITVISATKGEMGRRMGNPPFITRESMPNVREWELREACRQLGAEEPIFLGIRDKTVEFVDLAILLERVTALLRNLQPDVVLTFHERYGGHPDHCAIGKAATQAVPLTADPAYEAEGTAPLPVAPLLYFISFGEAMRQPERYGLTSSDIVRIDVSGFLQEKLLAFRAHRTQTELDEWVWKPDRQALESFRTYEYFMIGDERPRRSLENLLE